MNHLVQKLLWSLPLLRRSTNARRSRHHKIRRLLEHLIGAEVLEDRTLLAGEPLFPGQEFEVVGTARSRGDEPVTMTFTIQRVEPPTLLQHTHADADSYLRWELEPVDTGCVLRLSHFITDVDAAIGNCYVVGLHASLARLAPCLAGRPVAWDWDGFAQAQAHYADIGFAPPVHAP
jgi:hypothetical protein